LGRHLSLLDRVPRSWRCGQQHASYVNQSSDAVSICDTVLCIVRAVYAVCPQPDALDNLFAMDQRRSAIQCDHYVTTYPPITSNIDVKRQCVHNRCSDHRSSIDQSPNSMLIVQQPTTLRHASVVDHQTCIIRQSMRYSAVRYDQCDAMQCDRRSYTRAHVCVTSLGCVCVLDFERLKPFQFFDLACS
jgi:hypothetical protein